MSARKGKPRKSKKTKNSSIRKPKKVGVKRKKKRR